MFVSAWLLGCGVLADGSLLAPVPESPPVVEVPDLVVDEPLLSGFVWYVPREGSVEDPFTEPRELDCDETWEVCVAEGGDWRWCEEAYHVCLGGAPPPPHHCERLIETCLVAEIPEQDCEGLYRECMEPYPPAEDDGYDVELCYIEWEQCLYAGEDEVVCEEML